MVLDPKQEQIAVADRLQLLWLQHMERLLTSGEATSTDLATLARVLMANGWSIDPAQIPQNLRDKLTSIVDFTDPEEDDDT